MSIVQQVLCGQVNKDLVTRINWQGGTAVGLSGLDGITFQVETGERVGFGLVTVHERLRLLFAPPCGLTVDSRPGEGTAVTARIPFRSGEEGEL